MRSPGAQKRAAPFGLLLVMRCTRPDFSDSDYTTPLTTATVCKNLQISRRRGGLFAFVSHLWYNESLITRILCHILANQPFQVSLHILQLFQMLQNVRVCVRVEVQHHAAARLGIVSCLRVIIPLLFHVFTRFPSCIARPHLVKWGGRRRAFRPPCQGFCA